MYANRRIPFHLIKPIVVYTARAFFRSFVKAIGEHYARAWLSARRHLRKTRGRFNRGYSVREKRPRRLNLPYARHAAMCVRARARARKCRIDAKAARMINRHKAIVMYLSRSRSTRRSKRQFRLNIWTASNNGRAPRREQNFNAIFPPCAGYMERRVVIRRSDAYGAELEKGIGRRGDRG